MSDPKCERCGVSVTTGMMAVFCPRAEQCEFWPDDEQSQELVREFRRQEAERNAQQTPLENYIGSLGVTCQPDESLNWECDSCKALTSTMLTKCYVCGTPRVTAQPSGPNE